jgi:hypothetical protein
MKLFLRYAAFLLSAWLIIGWVSTYLSVRYLPSVRAIVRLKITDQVGEANGIKSVEAFDAFVGDLKPSGEYAILAESRITQSEHNPVAEKALNLLTWPFAQVEYLLRGQCIRFGA